MELFQTGDFILSSGKRSGWKIECDAITPEGWDALALMAIERLPLFSEVVGVPRGGIPFANALSKYTRPGYGLLVAEDVVTTGNSINSFAAKYREVPIGVCVFSRGKCPSWITPIFSMYV